MKGTVNKYDLVVALTNPTTAFTANSIFSVSGLIYVPSRFMNH